MQHSDHIGRGNLLDGPILYFCLAVTQPQIGMPEKLPLLDHISIKVLSSTNLISPMLPPCRSMVVLPILLVELTPLTESSTTR